VTFNGEPKDSIIVKPISLPEHYGENAKAPPAKTAANDMNDEIPF
jgi:hypothetical protein